jgi:hypothetical protein
MILAIPTIARVERNMFFPLSDLPPLDRISGLRINQVENSA